MSCKCEEKEGFVLLKIEGPMTVNEAAFLRNEMVEGLNTYHGLILDLNDVSECDTAGIQLLCSARSTALKSEKSFVVKSASISSINALERAGFEPEAILGATGPCQ